MQLRTKLIKISTVILLGLISVIFIFENYQSSLAHNNGFDRTFLHKELRVDTIIDLKFPGYYFAGKDNTSIYLGHLQAPAHILKYNLSNKSLQKIEFVIPLDSLRPINWHAINVKVDPPEISFIYGPGGFLYHSELSRQSKLKKIPVSLRSFDRFQNIDSSYIIRIYKPEINQNILAGIYKDSIFKEFILPKQIDGIFCTDGTLRTNHENAVVYVYYYRNSFEIFDSTLELQYHGRTIDTISKVQLELITLNDSSQITYSKPPLRVNKKAFLSNNSLYINSAIKANNEIPEEFNKNSVIDKYLIANASYEGSFYIPRYNNKKASDFEIINNTILAIYGNFLVVYFFK